MDEVKLLPCPFCGTLPRLQAGRLGGTAIVCPNDQCIISTDVPIPFNDVTHYADAITAWNTRAPQPEGEASKAVAWLYELATAIRPDGSYCNWNPPQVTLYKPSVPERSIRNLTALGPLTRPQASSLSAEEMLGAIRDAYLDGSDDPQADWECANDYATRKLARIKPTAGES